MMKNSFDRVFAERKAKLDAEASAAQSEDEKRQAFRARALEVLNSQIVPVLQLAAADLKGRGEEVEVTFSADDTSNPTATLKFRVATSQRSHVQFSPSSLTFSADYELVGFKARFELWVKGGKRETIAEKPDSSRLDGLSKAWVEHLVVGFVTAVVQGT